MKKKVAFLYLIPIGFTILFTFFALTGISNVLEFRIFDVFLRFRPSPPEDPKIMLIDIDDQTVSTIGTWPISRSITGDGLMLMAEMGAEHAIFDIEYTDKSPRGINSEVLEYEIPELLNSDIGYLQYNIAALFEAVAAGYIPIQEADEYIHDLVGVADQTKEKIIDAIFGLVIDNDEYLAQSARFFGNTWFTVNMRIAPEDNVPEGLREYAIEHTSIKNIDDYGIKTEPRIDIVPVIQPILANSAGIGFTNADADSDGIRRRIFLMHSYEESWFGQLVFRPLLSYMGDPDIELYPRKIVVKDALINDTYKTISIPISPEGSVLLDWPHKGYHESFDHLSFYFLYIHDKLFNDLIHNLRIGASNNYFYGFADIDSVFEIEQYAQDLKKDIMRGRRETEQVAMYRTLRDQCLEEIGAILDLPIEDSLMETVEEILSDPSLDSYTAAQYQQFLHEIPEFFASTTDVYENLIGIRKNQLSKLAGTFCIIGQTNTGSTDLGANPFAKAYPNIGTHASLVNMLINDKFLLELSPLWSAFISLCIGILLVKITKKLLPLKATALGFGIIFAVIGLPIILFLVTGKYLAMLPLASPILFSFISASFIRFFIAEKEKGFLRNAFSRYLSSEVIKQIIANPDKLQLGGEERTMTAIFTDIQGFSTLAEKMTPVELVAMLNRYLTGMSDLVLELGGTIDKYEGDAIIAFFGAPLDMEDHAYKALLSAVRMKRTEIELNKAFLSEKILTIPIKTRIGINTGQMVVGNMGTEKKMDYTIIGDAVNLAARLEGVNKRYGTYICISEEVKQIAGDSFMYRRLDRIRVVGKSVPIRIFEVIEEKERVDEHTKTALDMFESALDLFEEKNWKEALAGFTRVLELKPQDGPSTRFITTCNEYIANPPPENWDGVYKMDQK